MPTVLVVDDQAASRRGFVRLLQAEGYTTFEAANAFEAMALVKKCRPDMVLLDVMIPPMDGLTLLSILRDEPAGRDLPVILITGLNDAQTISRASDLGVRAYLVKSQFTAEELLELIRANVQNTPAPNANA